jgi:hypothetical protein
MSSNLFIDNKYTKWYNSIISNAQARGYRTRASAKKHLGYVELHHYIPKSLGGTKQETVFLTAKEHFTCHRLLTKMTTGPARYKMDKAVDKMLCTNKFQQRIKISARLYEAIRKQAGLSHSLLIKGTNTGEKNPFYGKTHSQETKNRISKANTGRTQIVTEEGKRQRSERLKGVPKTEAHKQAIKDTWNKEARTGINHPMYGKTQSTEARDKMRVSSARRWTTEAKAAASKPKNAPIFICPGCNRSVKGAWNFTQHTTKCC